MDGRAITPLDREMVMKNRALILSLHRRGETIGTLARKIQSGRPHVTQVLNNTPGRGHHTRKKLAPLLTHGELQLLGWDPSGRIVPRETQSST